MTWNDLRASGRSSSVVRRPGSNSSNSGPSAPSAEAGERRVVCVEQRVPMFAKPWPGIEVPAIRRDFAHGLAMRMTHHECAESRFGRQLLLRPFRLSRGSNRHVFGMGIGSLGVVAQAAGKPESDARRNRLERADHQPVVEQSVQESWRATPQRGARRRVPQARHAIANPESQLPRCEADPGLEAPRSRRPSGRGSRPASSRACGAPAGPGPRSP